MTCIRFPGGIICVSPSGRLKLGNKYIFLEFHEYCGPAFYTDRHYSKSYEPVDENDPIWPLFAKWLKKFQADKAKQVKHREKKSTTQKVASFDGAGK